MRLIDADKLHYIKGIIHFNEITVVRAKEINHAPTVEAISKADYEARLKADMVAMLTDLQLEIEELWGNDPSYIEGVYDAEKIIQQKINALKEDK